jgi:dynein heavy chain
MTMMFEVEDLAVASPATVSRCGMVYLEPGALGIEPLIKTWLQRIPSNIVSKRKNIVDKLAHWLEVYLEPGIEYMRKFCKEVITTMSNNLV